MTFQTALFASLLGVFAISSVVFTYTLMQIMQFTALHQGLPSRSAEISRSLLSLPRIARLQVNDYTYVDDDYPSLLPNFDPGFVQMTVEETVRFSMWDAEAEAEWFSVSPPADGAERLGPDGRMFVPYMFHELHCWRRLEQTFRDPMLAVHPSFAGHMRHCLNYLRQCSLCQVDRTLEIGDFVFRNFTVDRVGATHACRDWKAVYDRITYDQWSQMVAKAPASDES